MPEKRALQDQIVEILKENILKGAYSVNHQLPSLTELSKTFSVSMTTVQKALRILSVMGLVQSVPGKGNFVSSKYQNLESAAGMQYPIAFVSNSSAEFIDRDSYALSYLAHSLRRLSSSLRSLICLPESGRLHRVDQGWPLEVFQSTLLSGILIMHYNERYINALKALGIPMVCLDTDMTFIGVSSSNFDIRDATCRAAKKLISFKRKKLMHVGHMHQLSSGELGVIDQCNFESQLGLRDAVLEYGLESFEGQNSYFSGRKGNHLEEVAQVILENKVDGIIFHGNCEKVVPLQQRLKKDGYIYRKDYQLVIKTTSVANIGAYAHVVDYLMWGRVEEVAFNAVDLLLEKIKNPHASSRLALAPMYCRRPIVDGEHFHFAFEDERWQN